VNSDLYKKDDNDGMGMYRDDVALYQSSLDTRPNQRYYIQCPDGSLVIPPGNVFPDTKEDACFILPKSNDDKVWRWSYPTYLQQKHLLVFKESKRSPLLNEVGKQAKYNIYTKSYLNERQKKGVKPRNFLIGKEFLNRKGTDHIKKMGIKFNYSKPTALIDDLITSTNTNKNAIILDFFAGSGTTGEVVIELNKKDKGNRQFILCTNNENKICEEVTYPRMKAIVNGYGKKKGIPANIKYYKTDFVPFALTDNDKRTLVAKSTELLCIAESTFEIVLQNKKKLDYAIFKNETTQTAIIYDEDCIEKCCTELNKIKSKHKTIIYVFSYDHTYEDDDFENLKIDFIVKPIPKAIINVYRKISKLKNK
jgi:adenine-specific DNA-methyltransferase